MKKIWFFCLASLALLSCQNDEVPDGGQAPILLSAEWSAESTTRAGTDTEQNNYLDEGTEIKAYIFDASSPKKVTLPAESGVVYTIGTRTGEGTAGSPYINALNLKSGETQPYYPDTNDGKVNIYAVHPATASTSFAVSTTQTSVSQYKASDLMVATAAPTRTSGDIKLPFKHKLSKIIINFTSGTGTPKITKVELLSVKPAASFTSTSGAVGAAGGTATAITLLDNAEGVSSTNNIIGIIPPQEKTGAFIRMTLKNGGSLDYTIGDAEGEETTVTFSGETKYTYNLTVNLSGISVASATVADWTPGATRDRTVSL